MSCCPIPVGWRRTGECPGITNELLPYFQDPGLIRDIPPNCPPNYFYLIKRGGGGATFSGIGTEMFVLVFLAKVIFLTPKSKPNLVGSTKYIPPTKTVSPNSFVFFLNLHYTALVVQ